MIENEDKERQIIRASIRAHSASNRLKTAVGAAYFWCGFPKDDPTLSLNGLMQEVGELAELIAIDRYPQFHLSERKQKLAENLQAHIAHELGDVLTYAMAIAIHYQIVPTFEQWLVDRKPLTDESQHN